MTFDLIKLKVPDVATAIGVLETSLKIEMFASKRLLLRKSKPPTKVCVH